MITTNLFKTDKNIITYSWYSDKNESHKISGHLFEAIDFYLSLEDNQREDYMILLPDIDANLIDRLKLAIIDKYKPELIDTIMGAITFGRPRLLLTTKDIIVVDGVPPECEGHCENLILWLCSKEYWWVNSKRLFRITFSTLTLNYLKSIHNETVANILEILQDLKALAKKEFNIIQNVNFLKPIYIDNYNKPKWNLETFKESNTVRVLIYATGNCRALGDLDLEVFKKSIEEAIIRTDSLYLCKTVELVLAGANHKDTKVIEMLNNFPYKLTVIYENALPIINFHDCFDLYLYTPTAKNWDCSPRLLKECYHLQKPIVFCKEVIDNIQDNKGLKAVYDYMLKGERQ